MEFWNKSFEIPPKVGAPPNPEWPRVSVLPTQPAGGVCEEGDGAGAVTGLSVYHSEREDEGRTRDQETDWQRRGDDQETHYSQQVLSGTCHVQQGDVGGAGGQLDTEIGRDLW